MNNKAIFEAQKAFLGIGWAFPPQLKADGSLANVAFEEDIQQAILRSFLIIDS